MRNRKENKLKRRTKGSQRVRKKQVELRYNDQD